MRQMGQQHLRFVRSREHIGAARYRASARFSAALLGRFLPRLGPSACRRPFFLAGRRLQTTLVGRQRAFRGIAQFDLKRRVLDAKPMLHLVAQIDEIIVAGVALRHHQMRP